jgi:Transposase IS66 family
VRSRVRDFIETMMEEELEAVLSRPRYGRITPDAGKKAGTVGEVPAIVMATGRAHSLTPIFKRLEAYALSAERLHGDDTTVPVLAKCKTVIGRIWVYGRDDKPFGGQAPPGAVTRATGPASIPRLT